MKTFVCTVTFPDGNKIVAKARANSLDEEVEIEWSGVTDRLGQISLGRHSMGFLHWYMESRARQLQAEFEFRNGGGEATSI
jgi:hypothetical protein